MAETISRYTAELDSNSVKKARPSGGGGKSKLKTGKPKEGRTKGTTYLTPSTAKGKISAYAKFRQSHALGRFAVLAETEEEDAVSLEDDDTDDAPYAYPPHMEAILNPEPEPATATVDGDESGYQSTEAPAAGLQQGADVDEEMLISGNTASGTYGSSLSYALELSSSGITVGTTVDGTTCKGTYSSSGTSSAWTYSSADLLGLAMTGVAIYYQG
ncbi:hypothetical protein PF003_g28138 [Phytophthora fragariae]|nr:hypothetical protein PF003_g28138 [Phytophthora fragariae]